MHPVRAYDYLTQARAKLFDWIRPLTQEQYTREFPFGLHTLQATMLEIASGEWIYTRRLSGQPLPPPEARPFTKAHLPGFAGLEAAWADLAPQTRAILAGVRDWNESLEYRVEQPDKIVVITATAGDIATQLCFHEIHHRAQAMAMLRQLGVPAQNLDYNAFMYGRREEPRTS